MASKRKFDEEKEQQPTTTMQSDASSDNGASSNRTRTAADVDGAMLLDSDSISGVERANDDSTVHSTSIIDESRLLHLNQSNPLIQICISV